MVTATDLIVASRWIAIVVGIILIICGIFGSVFNLLIFSRKRFRKTSCAQYILVQSVLDIINLSFPLVVQVVVNGFAWPFFFVHSATCLARSFVAIAGTQSSIYCSCLLAFDRWASTSRSASTRQWSTVTRARVLVAMNLLLWALISIPHLFLTEIIQSNGVWQCLVTSKPFLNYLSYFFFPCLTVGLSVFLMIFFGTLTYLNISRIQIIRRTARMERQLTRMVLMQALITTIALAPYAAQYTYSTITSTWQKDSLWAATDAVIVQIGRMCNFLCYVPGFYIYMSTSSEVQATFKNMFLNLERALRRNIVTPVTAFVNNTNTHRERQV